MPLFKLTYKKFLMITLKQQKQCTKGNKFLVMTEKK